MHDRFRSGPSLGLTALLLVCFFASGMSALIYEVVWLKKLVLIFGSTTFAVSSVLAAFMLGLGLGSWIIGRLADRTGTGKLLLLYAALEFGIAGFGLLVPVILAGFYAFQSVLFHSFYNTFIFYNILMFLEILVILIGPVMLMGATFPVLSKILVRSMETRGGTMSMLYFINTFGGVAGVILSGFYLLPTLGVTTTNLTAVGINIGLGAVFLLSWFMRPRDEAAPAPEAETAKAVLPDQETDPAALRLGMATILLGTFCVGALSMTLEIVWTKFLAMIIGPDVYAFSAMLVTFLLGIMAGSLLIRFAINRIKNPLRLFGLFLLLIGVMCTLMVAFYNVVPWLYVYFFHDTLAGGLTAFIVRILVCSSAMLPPTVLIGATFPLALAYCTRSLGNMGGSIGKVYIFNTAGSVIGSFLCGFVLIPVYGMQRTIYLAVYVALIMGFLCIFRATPGSAWQLLKPLGRATRADGSRGMFRPLLGNLITLAGVVLIAAPFVLPRWNQGVITAGTYVYADVDFYRGADSMVPPTLEEFTNYYANEQQDIVFYQEGINSVVSVTRGRSGNVAIKVNGKVDASSSGDMDDQILLAQIPMLLATVHAPQGHLDKVLCIGFGSGTSLNVMRNYDVAEVHLVEIEEAVLRAARFFQEVNEDVLEDPKVQIHLNDGRNYLLLTDERYDVILSEPSNPFISGAAKLFTREFYEMARQRLTPGGIYAQWVPLYGFDEASLKGIVKSFVEVFPQSMLFNYSRANVVLIGYNQDEPPVFNVDRLAMFFEQPGIARFFQHPKVAMREWQEFFCMFNMGPDQMRAFTRDAEFNTDDNLLVEYLTPLDINRPSITQLQELMTTYSEPVTPWLETPGGPEQMGRLLFTVSGMLQTFEVNYELSDAYLEQALALGAEVDMDTIPLAIGETVRIRQAVAEPVNGWGCLEDHGADGLVVGITGNGYYFVNFGRCGPLVLLPEEIERVAQQ